jgi:hypothetical protein
MIQVVRLLKSDLQDVLIVLACGRICERERLFELSDIEVEGRDRVPAQRVRVGSEEVLNSRKGLAQLVEQLAQVIASLGLGGVGPEEEGKMLALLRHIAMQHEIGEQGLQAHAVEAGHLLVAIGQAKIAEQTDVKSGLHLFLLADEQPEAVHSGTKCSNIGA